MSLRGWLVSLPGVPDSWAKKTRRRELAKELEQRNLRVTEFIGKDIFADLQIVISKDHLVRVKIADEVDTISCTQFYDQLKYYADHNGYRVFLPVIWTRQGFIPRDVNKIFGPRGNRSIAFCKSKTIKETADFIEKEIVKLREKGAV